MFSVQQTGQQSGESFYEITLLRGFASLFFSESGDM